VRTSVRALSVVLLAAIPTVATAQQRALTRAMGHVTPYAGYMVMGNFLEGPLGLALSGSGGPLYGAQLDIPVADAIGFYANLARSSGEIRVGVPFLGGFDFGKTTMMLYDAGIQVELPRAMAYNTAFRPFAQVGAGGMQIEASAASIRTEADNVALNIGAGADITIGRMIGVRLMVKDYVGKVDFKEAVGVDLSSDRTHNVGITAGLRISF
jgi:hypothetical protein